MKRVEHQQAREKLEQLVAQASAAADQDGHSLSLIVLDVDEFRKVNETYGHDVGDQVLADLSRIIPQHIRDTDIFVRCGGEEYAIVSPKMALENAEATAEAIRSAVEKHTFPEVGQVTVSLGVTMYRSGDTPASLTARADRATHQAKLAGRNRVQVAS